MIGLGPLNWGGNQKIGRAYALPGIIRFFGACDDANLRQVFPLSRPIIVPPIILLVRGRPVIRSKTRRQYDGVRVIELGRKPKNRQSLGTPWDYQIFWGVR